MVWIKEVLLALLCTILLPRLVSDESILFSNSLFSVVFAAALICLFRFERKKGSDRRMCRYTGALGLLFSGMTACGYALEVYGSVPYDDPLLLCAIGLYAHVYAVLLRALWHGLGVAEARLEETGQRRGLCAAILNRPAVVAFLLLLGWLPCYLAVFPGNFVYDATREYEQMVSGFNGNFPLLHSVLITRVIAAAYALTGSYNAGIAAYVIAQMVLLAAMYAHMLCWLYREGLNEKLLGALAAYCGLFPVIHLLVTCTVRDVLFGGLVTYTTFLLFQMACDRVAFFASRRRGALLGISLVLTVLARNNNAGAFAAVLIVLVSVVIWLAARSANRRGAGAFLAAALGGYVLLSASLTALCQPLAPATANASLSVLTQPLARAYERTGDTWSEEERAAFQTYFETEGMRYVPENADSTKGYLVVSREDMRGFLRLWLRIGLRYPGCYLDAILANTRQMWFPDVVVDGYQEAETASYDAYGKCYFSLTQRIGQPGTQHSLLPGLRDVYTQLSMQISFERIPVVSMFFSIGFQFWLLLNACFYAAYRRAHALRWPLALLMGYTLFSALVPLVLLRYFSALFLAAPLVVVFTLQPGRCAASQRA